jgi:hypothetical protein
MVSTLIGQGERKKEKKRKGEIKIPPFALRLFLGL